MSWRPREQNLDDKAGSALGRGPARRSPAKRDRLLGVVLSVAAHLAVVVGLMLWVRPDLQKTFEPAAIVVDLVTEPRPLAPPAPTKPAEVEKPKPVVRVRRAPVKPPPRPKLARIVRAPRYREPLPTGAGRAEGSSSELSEAQLVGAASADSGPSGGECDMARWLQRALRKDPLVQAAVAQTHFGAGSGGRAIMVWNGDWVQSHGEDGKGLAAVREAIMWEVAFAPKACRSEPVRGLILISLNEGPGSARLAVGSGEWRWSDLLR